MPSKQLKEIKPLFSAVFNGLSFLGSSRSVIAIDVDLKNVNVVQSIIHAGKRQINKIVIEKIEVAKDGQRDFAVTETIKKAVSQFNTSNADIVCVINDQKLILDSISLPLMPADELAQAVKLQMNSSQYNTIDTPVVDFQVMGTTLEKGIAKTNVMVTAIAKASLDSFLNKFRQPIEDFPAKVRKLLFLDNLMDLNMSRVIPLSIAIESIVKSANISETIAVLHLGTATAELNIYRDKNLELSRKISVNGFDFVKSLTSAIFSDSGKIELTIAEAESLKNEHGIPLPGDIFLIRGKITANQVLALLRPKLEQLNREIQRCFDYYYDKYQVKKVDRLVLLGEAALIKRLEETLHAEIGIPVVIGNPLEGVDIVLDDKTQLQQRDLQGLVAGIGASLADTSKGLNLLPDSLRNLQNKFVQRALIVFIAGVLLIVSLLVYVGLFLQNNISRLSLESAKKEYHSLMPQVGNLKNKLLVEQRIHQRLNFGRIFMQLSHAPDNVSFTELSLENGTLVLSGFIQARGQDPRTVADRVMNDLGQNTLYNLRLESFKAGTTSEVLSEFTIKADLTKGKETNEVPASN